MDIKAADVKALREATGAGMMDCKKALVECEGDAEAAAKLLKEKGLAAVEKRSGRATKEGRIFIKIEGNKAAMVELTCETDFVAKNADFIAIGEKMASEVIANNYTEANEALSNMLLDLATKIRENMNVGRIALVDIPEGATVSKYIHSDGKTGVITVLTSDPVSDNPALAEFAYDCCLHIAAFNPAYVSRKDVDEKYLAEQKEIFTAQVAALDKPEKVKAGIIQGKLNKHLAEICFLDQPFVKDDKVSVSKKMDMLGKEIGSKITLNKVVSFVLGE